MRTNLRRFNQAGLGRFEDYVRRDQGSSAPPTEMLVDDHLTEVFSDQIELEQKCYESSYQLGLDICSVADKDGAQVMLADPMVWPWLSLFYHESVMPIRRGRRFVGAPDRHLVISNLEWNSYDHSHRHLIRTAVQAVHQFQEDARIMLTRPDQHTKMAEQIMSRKVGYHWAFSRDVVRAVRKLYWNPKSNAIRKGAKGTGPGGIERLMTVLRQLDVTYDVMSLDADQLLKLLPRPEFEFE